MRIARWQDDDGAEWVGVEAGAVLQPVAAADDPRAGDAALLALARGDRPATGVADPVDAGRVRRVAPLRRPGAIRDFSAFEAHVATARRARGLDMDADWYELPVFYFSNPHTVLGPDDVVPHPRSDALDYELEVAAVVGRDLADADEREAAAAIVGFTVFNDWSARDLQRREMRQGLGPAKGKDFASSFGPVLVTPDELGGTPDRPVAAMIARVNGAEWSRGELGSLHHGFGTMLAHASRDSLVRAGDLVGSGTVGSGCILELSAVHGQERHPWLAPGDVVELEVAGIGVLRNTIGNRSHEGGDEGGAGPRG